MNQINTIAHFPCNHSHAVITHGLRDQENKTVCGTTISHIWSDDDSWYAKQFDGGWMEKRIDYTDAVSCLLCRKSLGLGDKEY